MRSVLPRVYGDELALLVDADLVGGGLDLEHASARAVGHAVVVATHADAAFVAEAPLDAQHGVEAAGRQGLQGRPLLSEVLGHDAIGGAVLPDVGHRVEPVPQLPVHVFDVGEAPRHEEVGPDVAVRPLDLALGLRPIGLAGPGHEAVVRAQAEQLGVVDDGLVGVGLAEHRGLHAVVQDLARRAAEVLEGFHVTAQHGG